MGRVYLIYRIKMYLFYRLKKYQRALLSSMANENGICMAYNPYEPEYILYRRIKFQMYSVDNNDIPMYF